MSLSPGNPGVGLHGGLLHISNITQIFHIFVFIVTMFILQLTSFLPLKVLVEGDTTTNRESGTDEDDREGNYRTFI